MTENDFHAILGIPDVVIQKTELTSDDEFMIYVESTKEGATCHCCGKHTNTLGSLGICVAINYIWKQSVAA